MCDSHVLGEGRLMKDPKSMMKSLDQ